MLADSIPLFGLGFYAGVQLLISFMLSISSLQALYGCWHSCEVMTRHLICTALRNETEISHCSLWSSCPALLIKYKFVTGATGASSADHSLSICIL